MADEQIEMKNRIMEAVLDKFNEKGLKFTMDDIAKHMGMSKKTLYLYFEDKNALFEEMVEYTFRGIKAEQNKILADDRLSTTEKLKRMTTALPASYQTIQMHQIVHLREKYPHIYQKVKQRIESDWEQAMELLQQGIREGVFRKISPLLWKAMVEGTIEHLLTSDALTESGLSYEKAMAGMMDILMKGIVKGEE